MSSVELCLAMWAVGALPASVLIGKLLKRGALD
jgi:hypothetical protein